VTDAKLTRRIEGVAAELVRFATALRG